MKVLYASLNTSPFQRDQRELLRFLRDAPGGARYEPEIFQHLRRPKRYIGELLDSLKSADRIQIEPVTGGPLFIFRTLQESRDSIARNRANYATAVAMQRATNFEEAQRIYRIGNMGGPAATSSTGDE